MQLFVAYAYADKNGNKGLGHDIITCKRGKITGSTILELEEMIRETYDYENTVIINTQKLAGGPIHGNRSS